MGWYKLKSIHRFYVEERTYWKIHENILEISVFL